MPTHFMGGLAMRPVSVTDAATYTVLAKNSGKVHFVPDLSQDATWTLPAVQNGLSYTFIYTGTAADVSNWTINTVEANGTNLMKGGVLFADADAGPAAAEVSSVDADLSNDDTLTVNVPNTGTVINLVSDGTHWYVWGTVVAITAPAFS